MLYDFSRGKTTICDIDLYEKRPFFNRMGRLWGSRRFMSPEEFTLGAQVDEISNVYCMGAMAFALFADCAREIAEWPLGETAFRVAERATNDGRNLRQQSIRELIVEWEDALCR